MLQTQSAGHLCNIIAVLGDLSLPQIHSQQDINVRLRREIAARIGAVQIGVMDASENRAAHIINAVQDLLRLILGTHMLASNLCFHYTLNHPRRQRQGHDYCLTTISCKTEKADSPSVFNDFAIILKRPTFSLKTAQPLKIQHFIR